MLVKNIDHFTVRTDKLKETRDFYAELLGVKEGERPAFKFAGYWLYLGDSPLIHLVETAISKDDEVTKYLGDRDDKSGGSGAVDHISFRVEGYGSLLEKADKNGWTFFQRTVPDISEHQVFFRDPNGITIETIFHDSEYTKWQEANS